MARLAGVLHRGSSDTFCVWMLPALPLALLALQHHLIVCAFGGFSVKQHSQPLVATWLHGAWLGQPWAPALLPVCISQQSARQASRGLPPPIGHLGSLKPRRRRHLVGTHKDPGLEENCGVLVSAKPLAQVWSADQQQPVGNAGSQAPLQSLGRKSRWGPMHCVNKPHMLPTSIPTWELLA